MKKLLLLLLVALFPVLMPLPVSADHNQHHIDAKLSVAICHNVLHNGHVIVVADNALGAHAAHLAETDIILGIGLRADLVARFGDDNAPCSSTTTTTLPPVTTTTLPPVTTTTTVPEAPHVVCPDGNGFTFKQAPGPCPEIIKEKVGSPGTTPTPPAPAPPAPVADLDELPRTGTTADALLVIGACALIVGLLLLAINKLLRPIGQR